jgi:hypothetical protein
MRDCRLQGIKTIIERQERVPAEGDDDGLLFDRQYGGLRVLGTGRQINNRAALLPLCNGLWIDPVASSQGPQALSTMLYRSTDRPGEKSAPSKPGIKHLGLSRQR